MCFCIEQGQSSYCIQTDGVSAREELSASWRLKWTFARARTHTHTHTQTQMQPHTYALLLAQNTLKHA